MEILIVLSLWYLSPLHFSVLSGILTRFCLHCLWVVCFVFYILISYILLLQFWGYFLCFILKSSIEYLISEGSVPFSDSPFL